jgi:hypothetical protein
MDEDQAITRPYTDHMPQKKIQTVNTVEQVATANIRPVTNPFT